MYDISNVGMRVRLTSPAQIYASLMQISVTFLIHFLDSLTHKLTELENISVSLNTRKKHPVKSAYHKLI